MNLRTAKRIWELEVDRIFMPDFGNSGWKPGGRGLLVGTVHVNTNIKVNNSAGSGNRQQIKNYRMRCTNVSLVLNKIQSVQGPF